MSTEAKINNLEDKIQYWKNKIKQIEKTETENENYEIRMSRNIKLCKINCCIIQRLKARIHKLRDD